MTDSLVCVGEMFIANVTYLINNQWEYKYSVSKTLRALDYETLKLKMIANLNHPSRFYASDSLVRNFTWPDFVKK